MVLLGVVQGIAMRMGIIQHHAVRQEEEVESEDNSADWGLA